MIERKLKDQDDVRVYNGQSLKQEVRMSKFGTKSSALSAEECAEPGEPCEPTECPECPWCPDNGLLLDGFIDAQSWIHGGDADENTIQLSEEGSAFETRTLYADPYWPGSEFIIGDEYYYLWVSGSPSEPGIILETTTPIDLSGYDAIEVRFWATSDAYPYTPLEIYDSTGASAINNPPSLTEPPEIKTLKFADFLVIENVDLTDIVKLKFRTSGDNLTLGFGAIRAIKVPAPPE